MTQEDTEARDRPRYAVGRFSELGDRWDAPFHLARIHLQSRVDELRGIVSEEEAVRRLKALPAHARKNIHVLTRGDRRGVPSSAQIDVAIETYPHLSLALVEKSMRPIAERILAEIEQRNEMLSTIVNLTTPRATPSPASVDDAASEYDEGVVPLDEVTRSTKEGVMYPLRDPERYDDEHGTGFGHVMVPRGGGEGEFRLRDMWIVDENGEPHPGYDACPVPVLIDDVDVAAGMEVDVDLPKPVAVFDGPWSRP